MKPRDLAEQSRHRARTFASDKGFATREQREAELRLSEIRRGNVRPEPGNVEEERAFAERRRG